MSRKTIHIRPIELSARRRDGRFLVIYPPLVKSGLNGPPLGIQHIAWALEQVGGQGAPVDLNIMFTKELTSDGHVSSLLAAEKTSSTRQVMLSSLASIAENDRLKFPRAFDIVLPHRASDPTALSVTAQLELFHGSGAYRELLMRLESEADLRVVGISILSFTQLSFAIDIARTIRQIGRATIVFGGSEISGWSPERIMEFAAEDFVDHIVLGDGETAIQRIWLEEPGLGVVVQGEPMGLSSIPISASFQVDPSPYLKPTQLNIVESKGCYWNKCTHCDYIALNSELDFGRSAEALVSELDAVANASGIRSFHLVNETLTPSRARKLAAEVRRRNSDIRWNSFVKIDSRFDRTILEELPGGGCEFLVIGLESLSDRALASLDKGYTAQEALDWIRTARACGVNLVLNFIVGIPGTNAEDDDITLERLAEFPDLAARSKVFTFVVSRMSMIGMNPDAFGVEVVGPSATGFEAHRGGSSLTYRKPNDLEQRVERFKAGIQRLSARHRLAGPLGRIILAARFGFEIPEAIVQISSSVAALRLRRERRDICEVYDYRNGTRMSIPGEYHPDLAKCLESRRFSTTEFLTGKRAAQRAELLRYLGEAGFARMLHSPPQ